MSNSKTWKIALSMVYCLLSTQILAKSNDRNNVFVGAEMGAAQYGAKIWASTSSSKGEIHDYSAYTTFKMGKYSGREKYVFDLEQSRSIGYSYSYFYETPIEKLRWYLGIGIFYGNTGLAIPLTIGVEYDINAKYSYNVGARTGRNNFDLSSYGLGYDMIYHNELFFSFYYHLQ